MKLVICWCEQISERGTEVAMFDYGRLLKNFVDIDLYVVYDGLNKLNCSKTVENSVRNLRNFLTRKDLIDIFE